MDSPVIPVDPAFYLLFPSMSRVKRGVTVRRRHNKLLALTKGYGARRKSSIRLANQAMQQAGKSAYKHRRLRKRSFRGLWNIRIGAAVAPFGLNYSRFINGLFKKTITLNRKMLSELAIQFPKVFEKIVASVK